VIQQIKDDIEKRLEDIYVFDYDFVKSEIEYVLNNYTNFINDSKVVCDNTNNTFLNDYIIADVYIKQPNIQYLTINCTIIPDRIKALREERIKKLKKLDSL